VCVAGTLWALDPKHQHEHQHERDGCVTVRRWTLYGLAFLGFVVGLSVLLFAPLPVDVLNYLVGGVFLAIAVASVTSLITRFSGPGERGPDF